MDAIKNCIRSCLFLWALVASGGSAQAWTPTVSYETQISLTGRLIVEDVYGPPNYGESPQSDASEKAVFLLLDAPISVVGGLQSDLNLDSFEDVSKVQLTAPIGFSYMEYLEEHVVAQGALFQGHTGHHHTVVVLQVTSLEIVE